MTARAPDRRPGDARFAPAQAVADAVLYEGYVLYPYRASARKNQVRWQFGVLMPPAYTRADPSERTASVTECLLEPGEHAQVRVRARFLQVQAKRVEERTASGFRPVESAELGGHLHVSWDEALEHQVDAERSLAQLLEGPASVPFEFPGGRDEETVVAAGGGVAGRIVRDRWPLAGELRMQAETLGGPFGAIRLRLVLENASSSGGADDRDGALRHALVAAHSFVAVEDARFISLLDPPEWAGSAAASCENVGTFPVLVGEPERGDLLLSSPIILYDFPEIAPESPGDLYDATEIDEILSLRTLALTEEEKREARATDPRAAAIIDRVDAMPPELMDRLHGAVRDLRRVTGEDGGDTEEPPTLTTPSSPWWNPGMDASVSPETDHVLVGGVEVARGSRVVLRPTLAGADAQDMFLDGRVAKVEAVLHDVDGGRHLAVVLEEDPAADLLGEQGRFLYFSPDEVEPIRAEAAS